MFAPGSVTYHKCKYHQMHHLTEKHTPVPPRNQWDIPLNGRVLTVNMLVLSEFRLTIYPEVAYDTSDKLKTLIK